MLPNEQIQPSHKAQRVRKIIHLGQAVFRGRLLLVPDVPLVKSDLDISRWHLLLTPVVIRHVDKRFTYFNLALGSRRAKYV